MAALTTLPNGLQLEAPTPNEARILYTEIFETNGYLRNGVTVSDGDTILDVGANIGAFSVALAQTYADLRILAFEPIPMTFAILERNASRLLTGARVTLVKAGVGATPGRMVFQIDPRSSCLAAAESAVPSGKPDRGRPDLVTRTRAALADAERAGVLRPRLRRGVTAGLRSRLARPLILGSIRLGRAVFLIIRRIRTKRVDCELTTVSAALRQYAVEVVDLIKIDVEGAEWDVLQGIEDADWPRVRQLALEVHDVDGRVEQIRSLLQSKGFRVAVEAADWETLRLQGLHNVFATRDR